MEPLVGWNGAEAENNRALAMFSAAIHIGSKRSAALAQLSEAAKRALAGGERQLDSIRLNGLRITDEDVEVLVLVLVSIDSVATCLSSNSCGARHR